MSIIQSKMVESGGKCQNQSKIQWFFTICDIFQLKLIYFKILDLFSAAGIDFVATIQISTTISNRKCRLNDHSNSISKKIWLKVNLIALAYRAGYELRIAKNESAKNYSSSEYFTKSKLLNVRDLPRLGKGTP